MKNIITLKRIAITVLFIIINITILFSQTPKWQWVRGGGSDMDSHYNDNFESCNWIGTDANGNIYGTSPLGSSGNTQIDTSYFNGFGEDDFAVFSYKCDGTFRWARYFGSSGDDLVGGLTVDDAGNVYIAGEVLVSQYGDAYFGDSIIPATSSMSKCNFIAKLDSNGHTVWLNLPGPAIINWPDQPYFLQMEKDNLGNICELVRFTNSTNWNGFTIPVKGWYVLKFNSNNGNLTKVTKLDIDTTGNTYFFYYNFKIDKNNNYYLQNHFLSTSTVSIGGVIYMPDSIYSIYSNQKSFIAKFDTNGNNNLTIIKTGNPQDSTYMGIGSISIIGNSIYCTGWVTNGGNFFGTTIHNSINNIYNPTISCIAKLDATTGAALAVNQINCHGFNELTNLVSDKQGNIIISGYLGDIVVLNVSDTIKLNGINDKTNCLYLANIDTNLTHFNWSVATRVSYNTANNFVKSMFMDDKNNLFVGGMYEDSLYDNNGNNIKSNGAFSDFFVAKVSVSNDCNCTTAIPNIQVINLLNNTLTVKGNATGTLDSLYWFWGDGTHTKYITQNTNVSHTYQNAGNYTVCLRTYNYCGSQDSCTHVTMVGINETELKEIKTYPNPVNKDLIIENPYYKPLKVTVYNSMGLLIYQKQYENQTITIDMSNYVNGVYILKLSSDNGMLVRKIVKE